MNLGVEDSEEGDRDRLCGLVVVPGSLHTIVSQSALNLGETHSK